jgi:hypothetical protein
MRTGHPKFSKKIEIGQVGFFQPIQFLNTEGHAGRGQWGSRQEAVVYSRTGGPGGW